VNPIVARLDLLVIALRLQIEDSCETVM
jgi:hypothetical protein